MKRLRDLGKLGFAPNTNRFLRLMPVLGSVIRGLSHSCTRIVVVGLLLLTNTAHAQPTPTPQAPQPTSPATPPTPQEPQDPGKEDGEDKPPQVTSKGGIGFDKSPVGRQLEWVLRCINQAAAPDAQGRFAPRFLEQFTVEEAQELLSTLKGRTFKGEEVSLIEHLNEKRADAVTVLIGNEDIERYLSLLLTVNEETGKITGMIFSISMGGQGDAANAWDAFDGEAGKLQNGVWFGAYEVNVSDPGTPQADARIAYVYEFGDFKLLNISSFSRVYLLIAAMRGIQEGQLTLDDKIAPAPGHQGQDQGGGTGTLREILTKTARGDERAADALLTHLSPSVVERTVINMQESPQFTLPYLSFAQRSMLLDPQNVNLVEEFNSEMGALRREMMAEGGPLHLTLAGKHVAKPWTPSNLLQRVGWFSSNKEAGYAMAVLRMLEQDPALKDVGTLWRQEQPLPVSRSVETSTPPVSKQAENKQVDTKQPEGSTQAQPAAAAATKPPRTKLDLDPKIWLEHAAISGSEPGVMTLGFLLKRDDNRWFTMVLAWNNIDGPLDEPRLYDLAQRGVEILAKHDRPEVQEEPVK